MENEIKVNEYARDDFGNLFVVIGKYERGQFGEICVQLGDFKTKEFAGEQWERNIKIGNLIDLIQCGDYVNGEQITDIWYGNRISSVKSNFNEEDIENIVTKEQFESISYKVKQEEN